MKTCIRRLLAAALALLLLPLTGGAYIGDDPEELLRRGYYSDVPAGAWYAEAAAWARVSGILEGTSKSTFSPEEVVTRAQFLAVLYEMAGSPLQVAGSKFPDVACGRRDAAALLWAAETGVTTGVSPTALAPDAPLTRQQGALFLYRLSGLPNISAGTDAPLFPDLAETAPWAAEGVAWAVETGLLVGLPDGLLHPGEAVTRAQMAVLLQRFYVLSSS